MTELTEWAKGYAAGQASMIDQLQKLETLSFQQQQRGIEVERARVQRIIKRHLLSGGQLVWNMDKQMTAAEFVHLIQNGDE